MILGKGKYRNVLTVALIAILLFNYANVSLFWHWHKIGTVSVAHSHFYGKTHGTGSSSCSHTPGEFLIIDLICHAAYTSDALPAIHLERRDVLECVLTAPVVPEEEFDIAESLSLRGPPALV